jgi:cyclophilin family peptidyl-prolyl cis-trans isomerase
LIESRSNQKRAGGFGMSLIVGVVSLVLVSVTIVLFGGCRKNEPKNPVVVLETSDGNIELELFPDVAPLTVKSFLKLVNEGFYDSLKFHRVIDGFMIQSGDALSAGRRRPEFTIVNEANDSTHHQGTLAMARGSDPNSASSQFYICVGTRDRLKYLDQMKYTVFGRVIKGMDVALAIGKTPTSGSGQRIMQDSVWRDRLIDLKKQGAADVVFAQDSIPMPDRPLKPVYILKAYQKK